MCDCESVFAPQGTGTLFFTHIAKHDTLYGQKYVATVWGRPFPVSTLQCPLARSKDHKEKVFQIRLQLTVIFIINQSSDYFLDQLINI